MKKAELAMLDKMIQSATVNAVKITVNGKLDKISHELSDQRQTLQTHIDIHNMQWKQLQPILDAWNNLTGFKKITFPVIGVVILVIGALGGVGGIEAIISWWTGK